MKKFWIVIMLLVGAVGCTACSQKQETKLTKEEKAAIKRGYNLPISKKKKEKAKTDSIKAYQKKQSDYESSDYTVAEVRTVLESKRKKLEHFIKQSQKGKKGKIVLYQMDADEMLIREEFSFDGEDMYYLYNNTSKNTKGQIITGAYTKSRIKSWEYTKKGWFMYEFCEPKTTEEIDTRAMIRVKPWNKEYLKYAQKYINPIGYKGNNLFMIDWDFDQMDKLDYNGLYEYFYAMKNGKRMRHTEEEIAILPSKFEDLMMEFLPVTASEVRKYASYNTGKDGYAWVELACGNYAPNAYGTSIPEVTKVEKLQDGSIKLTVDAVCEMLGDDQLETHEVTLKFENSKVKYLGNKVLHGKENIPEYKKRVEK